MTALSDVLRFALELAGVASLAVWGWVAGGSGLLHYVGPSGRRWSSSSSGPCSSPPTRTAARADPP